jgi:hypothetical protein
MLRIHRRQNKSKEASAPVEQLGPGLINQLVDESNAALQAESEGMRLRIEEIASYVVKSAPKRAHEAASKGERNAIVFRYDNSHGKYDINADPSGYERALALAAEQLSAGGFMVSRSPSTHYGFDVGFTVLEISW